VYLTENAFRKIRWEILRVFAIKVGTIITACIGEAAIRQNVAAWADANFAPISIFAFPRVPPIAKNIRITINVWLPQVVDGAPDLDNTIIIQAYLHRMARV